MYENYFGFSGSPFNLNPDPAFYFGSRGHSNALSYLKFGVYQGEGFVVVTGEIGAGKTTLVRTLLSDLDSESIVAAQILSTQLEAGDLLRSVALAFGVTTATRSKAELIASIEAFLTALVIEGKRALLIVDEAQNLNREAVEELRMLSNFQIGNRALLQSFLVGQPELRALLTSKPMEQFRQRVIASCHLGPMDRQETRAYIEHRLHQVGWAERPAFEEAAFERVHGWTGGIPRRVNLLCNRLLLSAYLEERDRIGADDVEAVGRELRGEVGEAQSPMAAVPEHVATSALSARGDRHDPVAPTPSPFGDPAVTEQPTLPLTNAGSDGASPALMFVITCADEMSKMTPLMRQLHRRGALSNPIVVCVGEDAARACEAAAERLPEARIAKVTLDIGPARGTDEIAAVLSQFAPVVERLKPWAVIVHGDSDAVLACSLVTRKKDCRLVHLDAGRRADSTRGVLQGANSALVDRLADRFYAAEMPPYLNLIREGIADAHVELVGQLPDEPAAKKIAAHMLQWLAAQAYAPAA